MKEEHTELWITKKLLSMKTHVYIGEEFKNEHQRQGTSSTPSTIELGLTPANSRCRGKTRDNYR